MPYNGGLEDYEHLKQQAADAQRRAQQRMTKRQREAINGQSPSRPRPWWAFWQRLVSSRGTRTAVTPESNSAQR